MLMRNLRDSNSDCWNSNDAEKPKGMPRLPERCQEAFKTDLLCPICLLRRDTVVAGNLSTTDVVTFLENEKGNENENESLLAVTLRATLLLLLRDASLCT